MTLLLFPKTDQEVVAFDCENDPCGPGASTLSVRHRFAVNASGAWERGICGWEKAHQPGECRRKPTLTPFELRFIGHRLGEHSIDQDRHEEDGICHSVRAKLPGSDGVDDGLLLNVHHSTLGANASADGTKLGTGLQKRSCATARFCNAQRPPASSPTVRASSPGSPPAMAVRRTSRCSD